MPSGSKHHTINNIIIIMVAAGVACLPGQAGGVMAYMVQHMARSLTGACTSVVAVCAPPRRARAQAKAGAHSDRLDSQRSF